MFFSKRKFLSLSLAQRHKKCAELLRRVYAGEAELARYHTLSGWLNLPKLASLSCEILSNRYHLHLQQAGMQHREANLLPHIRRGDTVPCADWLDITIYLDHIRSAHNVGSIVRTVEAFRLGRLVLSEQVPGLDQRQVQSTSMGSWQWVSWSKIASLATLCRPVIALETSEDAVPLHTFRFPPQFTLAVGSEEYGCSAELLAAADHLVEIPLVGRKNSLNVANALSIAAAEIRRQL